MLLWFLLIVPLFISAQGPDFDACNSQNTVELDKQKTYGSLNGFYSIAKGIGDGLQKQMNNETLKDIYNLISPPPNGTSKSTIDVIDEIIKDQAGAIAFWCVGIALAVGSIVLAISICVSRCCCNCCGADNSSKGQSSIITKLILIFLFITIFAFVITGIIIFSQSMGHFSTAVNESPKKINKVVQDLQTSLTIGTGDINCAVNQSIDLSFDTIRQGMNSFPYDLTTQFLVVTGFQAVSQFNNTDLIASLNAATESGQKLQALLNGLTGSNLCQDSLKTYKQSLTSSLSYLNQDVAVVTAINTAVIKANQQIVTQTSNNMKQVNDVISEAMIQLNTTQQQTSQAMASIDKSVAAAMDTVRHLQNSIDKAQHDIVTWSGYNPVKSFVEAAMIIPNAFALLFCTLVTLALIVSLFKGNQTAGSKVAIVGGYVIIFIAWWSMLMAILTFVPGWAISGLCVPMFQDPNFRIFSVVDGLTFTITGLEDTSTTFTAQQLLEGCMNNKTLFNVVHGDRILNTKLIDSMMDLDQYSSDVTTNINDANLGFVVAPQDAIDQLQSLSKNTTNSYNDISAMKLTDCDLNNALKSAQKDFNSKFNLASTLLSQYVPLIVNLNAAGNNQTGTKDQLTSYTNQQFNLTYDSINNSTDALIVQLNTQTFPCLPLYNVYANSGNILCDYFGRPIQGLWAAAGLAAIFFIPLAIILFCSARVLLSGRTMPRRENRKIKEMNKRETATWDTDDDGDIFRRPPITYTSQPQGLQRDYTQTDQYPAQNEWDSAPRGLRREQLEGTAQPRALPRADDQNWGGSTSQGLRRVSEATYAQPTGLRRV